MRKNRFNGSQSPYNADQFGGDLFTGDSTTGSSPAPPVTDFLLQEDGFFLLQEDGSKIIIT